MNNFTGAINSNDYPILIVIAGAVMLVISLFGGNEFAFFIILPMSIVMIGIGAALAARRNDSRMSKKKGFAKYQRLILFVASMLLLSFFAYVLAVLFL